MESLRDYAPLLGVILPAIGAFFLYRQTERNKAKELASELERAKRPALNVIGGAIASIEGAKLYVEEFQRLTHSIDRLAEAFILWCKHGEGAAARMDHAVDELRKMRRSMEEVAAAAEKLKREEREKDGR